MESIKEFLPFYIGQECSYPSGKGKLVGVCEWAAYIETENVNQSVSLENVVPHLRKLESMTEEERKELYALVFKKKFPDTGRIQFYPEKTTSSDPRFVLMSGVDWLGIEANGTVWADCDLHTYKHNQHEVTRWLLKKGFWLWSEDYFKEGIIIEKTV